MSDTHADQFDVAIVGAGVIGMSLAWNLSAAGARSVVIDRSGIGAGATAVQPGGVRTQWTSPDTCRMALESRAFYDEIAEILEPVSDPGLDPCGYVFAASNETTMTELRQRVVRQNQLGVTSVTVSATDIADLVPGIDPSLIVGGAYNPSDGYFDRPGAVVTAFADAARRHGAQVRIGRVTAITSKSADWVLDVDAGSPIVASNVVIAAGVETADLVGLAGSDLPISQEPRYLFFSNPIKTFLVRPLLVFQDEHFATKHLSDGSVLASDLRYGLAGERDDETWRQALTRKARRLVPLLEHVRFPITVEGYYDVTPDAQLVVGPVPERAGLWVASGMNGRGLMLAPSVGKMLAAAIQGRTDAIPAALLPERFSGSRALAGESQVI